MPGRKESICLTQLCNIAYSSFFVHKMSRTERDEDWIILSNRKILILSSTGWGGIEKYGGQVWKEFRVSCTLYLVSGEMRRKEGKEYSTILGIKQSFSLNKWQFKKEYAIQEVFPGPSPIFKFKCSSRLV